MVAVTKVNSPKTVTVGFLFWPPLSRSGVPCGHSGHIDLFLAALLAVFPFGFHIDFALLRCKRLNGNSCWSSWSKRGAELNLAG